MNTDDLLKRLGALGFPLFEAEKNYDANLTLADLVKSCNPRLLEGFPVVLANANEMNLFSYHKVNQYLKKTFLRPRLLALMVMSLALYKALNLRFPWADNLYENLAEGQKRKFKDFVKGLKADEDLPVGDCLMSSQRLKSTFDNYFRQKQQELDNLVSLKEKFGVEYALSQLFSPKQKELFFKKLKGEKLTKTEREYFSRVVKKKVLALANPELNRLAQKLL